MDALVGAPTMLGECRISDDFSVTAVLQRCMFCKMRPGRVRHCAINERRARGPVFAMRWRSMTDAPAADQYAMFLAQ